MNTRLLKEFRQLLPAWCVAMLLAAVPAHFNGSADQPELKIAAYVFGLLCLAVSSFGPEFSHRTFAMLMAQPVPRARLWREKSNTLLAAAGVVVLTFCLSTMTFSRGKVETITAAVVLAPVLVAGGLWMALAFRQVVIAFFFAMGLPTLLSTLSSVITETRLHEWSLEIWCATMLIYAALAFWFARRLFLGAQDYHWTGGEIAFGFKVRRRDSPAGSPPSRQSPVWALIKKEFFFQQSSLICALVVAGVTVIGVVLGKATGTLLPTATGTSEFFAAFAIGFPILSCFVLPLLTGALSIAEERRLGTLDAQQSLPMSRWRQFVVKGGVTFALSIALGAVLPWLLIEAGQAVLGNPGSPSSNHPPFGFLLGAAMVMTTLAFYSSSLTRSTIHAVVLAVGLIVILVIPLGVLLASFPYVVRRMGFAQGGEALVWLLGLPVGLVVLMRLSFTNYCARVEGWRLAWHNVRAWLLTALAVGAVSTAVYHRSWEWVFPDEPAHGSARLSQSKPPRLISAPDGGRVIVLLPDGRLWMGLRSEARVSSFGSIGYQVRIDPLNSGFIAGTNWLDAAMSVGGCYAVRHDGSLWLLIGAGSGGDSLIRVGSDSDWKAIAAGTGHFLTLKRDGTLWGWGVNSASELTGPKSKVSVDGPIQIGAESNWAAIYAGGSSSIAVKTDGTLWRWGTWNVITNSRWTQNAMEQPTQWESLPTKPIIALQAANSAGTMVFADGSLWAWGTLPALLSPRRPPAFHPVVRLGNDTNWTDASLTFDQLQLAAIRRDGSLWAGLVSAPSTTDQATLDARFSRRSQHSDWLALAPFDISLLALSADGNLWLWENQQRPTGFLAPSRRPQKLANIFE